MHARWIVAHADSHSLRWLCYTALIRVKTADADRIRQRWKSWDRRRCVRDGNWEIRHKEHLSKTIRLSFTTELILSHSDWIFFKTCFIPKRGQGKLNRVLHWSLKVACLIIGSDREWKFSWKVCLWFVK